MKLPYTAESKENFSSGSNVSRKYEQTKTTVKSVKTPLNQPPINGLKSSALMSHQTFTTVCQVDLVVSSSNTEPGDIG